MAGSIEGDTDVLSLGLLAPALIALTSGLVIHSFIIGVNVSDWWRGRSVTPVDHIVTSLGISRMCSQFALTLGMLVENIILQNMYSKLIVAFIESISIFFSFLNIWSTALLSTVFCLKISNLHTRLFLYLRRIILQRTGYLYIASLFISAISCLMPLVNEVNNIRANNESRNHNFTVYPIINSYYNYTIGGFVPLLLYCIFSILLLVSLYHHTTRMKMSRNLSINLETYYSVMRFVSVTLIYNTVYFFVDFVSVFYYYVYCMNLPWLYIILEFLPVVHSSYLIYRTAKFRSQMSKVLQNIRGLLFESKHAETRENAEVVTQ